MPTINENALVKLPQLATAVNAISNQVKLNYVSKNDAAYENVIDTVKLNGTALVPDSNKAVDVVITPADVIVTPADTTNGTPAVTLADTLSETPDVSQTIVSIADDTTVDGQFKYVFADSTVEVPHEVTVLPTGVVTTPTWDASTLTLTMPVTGSATGVEINFAKDKFIDSTANNRYENGNLYLYLNDGDATASPAVPSTEIIIPVTSLITDYIGTDTNSITVDVDNTTHAVTADVNISDKSDNLLQVVAADAVAGTSAGLYVSVPDVNDQFVGDETSTAEVTIGTTGNDKGKVTTDVKVSNVTGNLLTIQAADNANNVTGGLAVVLEFATDADVTAIVEAAFADTNSDNGENSGN